MDRTEKREFVAGLHQALADTSMIVVTHNTGLTVAEATDLRRRMRTAGVTFKIAKNRLWQATGRARRPRTRGFVRH